MDKRKIYLIVDKDKAERLVRCFPELKRRTVYNLAFEKGIEVLLHQKEEQKMYNNYAFYKRVNGIYKVVRVIENGLSYVDGHNWVADEFEDRDEMEEEYVGFKLVRVKKNTIAEILGMGYPA